MKKPLVPLVTSSFICLLLLVSSAFAEETPLNKDHVKKHSGQPNSNLKTGHLHALKNKHDEVPVYCGDVLSTPGFYRLDSDLYCTSSIKIASSDIHLDFNRHSLTCNAQAWEYPDDLGVPEEDRDVWVKGINVNFNDADDPSLEPTVTNVHISNGTITNCQTGILLFKTEHSTVKNMTLRENLIDASCCSARGIETVDSHKNAIVKNNSLDGIYLSESNANNLTLNVSSNNSWGVYLDRSSDNSISKNKTINNVDTGITLLSSSDRNRIVKNRANNNGTGILVIGVTVTGIPIGLPIPADNVLAKNTARNNDQADILEGNIDFSDFSFSDFDTVVGDECYNMWLQNSFGFSVAIDNCIK